MGRRKKKKTAPIIKYLFTSMLILTLVTIGLIYFIDILPFNYFCILTGLLAGIDTVFACLLFNRRPVVKGFGGFITTIYIVLMIFVIIYELNTIDFLKKIGESEYVTLNYNVVVLKDSKFKNINDVINEKVGITSDFREEATKKLNKKVNVKYVKYSNYTELADKLLDKSLNVIVLEDSAKAILEEEVEGFNDLTKTLYEFSVDIKQKSIKEEVDLRKEPFNIFVSGIDTYGSINSASRSDVNMIITVNPNTGKIILTSIPRDYYVKLSNVSEYDKLTHAGIYGIDTSVSTVEELLNIKINYYIKVNFTSLVKTVNTLDGIDVDSKYAFKSRDGYTYQKGMNHLNGEKALSFARERKALPYGDKSRGENQQAVLAGIINKASSKSILTKYNSLLKTLKPSMVTNFSNKEITNFIKMQIDKDIKWNIEYVNLDGFDGYEYTYSFIKNKLYVMIPDEESVKNASDIINENLKK